MGEGADDAMSIADFQHFTEHGNFQCGSVGKFGDRPIDYFSAPPWGMSAERTLMMRDLLRATQQGVPKTKNAKE